MVKRCLYCGRFFTPDYRLKDRQKSCGQAACRKARKKAAQKAWVEKNPDYFDDLYERYVKPWRKRRMIKDEIRPLKPCRRLVILIPDDGVKMIKDTITVRRVGIRTFAAYGYG